MSRFAALFAAVLVTTHVAAIAQPQGTTVTAKVSRTVVSYADLDLNSVAGQRILKRRISGAIEGVCGSFAGVREQSEEREIDACRTSAQRSADRQLAARGPTHRLALLIAR